MKTLAATCRWGAAVLAVFLAQSQLLAGEWKTVRAEFIYEKAPFPECHASTLVETKTGMVAAWFGGTREKNPDVGIWVARQEFVSSGGKPAGTRWTTPIEVATGVQSAGKRFPTWNPVLFYLPNGELLLFYKVGPSPDTWWGMLIRSKDDGQTWSDPEKLPEGILGPIKNKPILLPDGRLLCGSSTEHDGWRVHCEWTCDGGKTWKKSTSTAADQPEAIQPAFLRLGENKLQMLCRPRLAGKVLSALSSDGGETWSKLFSTSLPNPNSGIDAVTLSDSSQVVIYNHSATDRCPLNVAHSTDGQTWQTVATLEKEAGEYSYPAIIQAADGTVQATYTWKRQRIKYVVLQP